MESHLVKKMKIIFKKLKLFIAERHIVINKPEIRIIIKAEHHQEIQTTFTPIQNQYKKKAKQGNIITIILKRQISKLHL